ncbi:calsenilin-like [Cololabis saira]|uniref:calsenilin-like n=1 Tax=Cololabis saira TaxID=129043 RepID=UPI002AD535F9|nr:calsenilin-like [Cololabis saira]
MQADGKVADGSLLGDANGVEPAPSRAKQSGKWQKPRFSRKALMKCCLVKWIIASTQPQDKGHCQHPSSCRCLQMNCSFKASAPSQLKLKNVETLKF